MYELSEDTTLRTIRHHEPTRAYEEAFQNAGLVMSVFRLVLDSQSWVHRVVESVRFINGDSVRRHVSVDFSVPPDPPTIEFPDGRRVALLPIAVLRRAEYVNFDLRDECGYSVPALPLVAHEEVFGLKLLRTLARLLVPDCCNRDLDEQIRTIVQRNTQVGEEFKPETQSVGEAIDRLNRLAPETPSEGWQEFLGAAKTIGRNIILIAPVEDPAAYDHHILKYAYDRPIPWYKQRLRSGMGFKAWLGMCGRFVRSFGSRLAGQLSDVFQFPICGAAYAKSYHFEATAPDGTEISGCALYDSASETTLGQTETPGPGATRSGTRCMAKPGMRVRAAVAIQPHRGGWLSAALIATLLAAAGFWALRLLIPPVHHGGDTDIQDNLVLLTVTIAVVVLAALFKPGVTGIATHLLLPVRIAAGIAAASAVLFAGFATFAWSSEALHWMSLAVAIVISASAAWQALAYIRMAPASYAHFALSDKRLSKRFGKKNELLKSRLKYRIWGEYDDDQWGRATHDRLLNTLKSLGA